MDIWDVSRHFRQSFGQVAIRRPMSSLRGFIDDCSRPSSIAPTMLVIVFSTFASSVRHAALLDRSLRLSRFVSSAWRYAVIAIHEVSA